jgi:hypothetical protein
MRWSRSGEFPMLPVLASHNRNKMAMDSAINFGFCREGIKSAHCGSAMRESGVRAGINPVAADPQAEQAEPSVRGSCPLPFEFCASSKRPPKRSGDRL